ncbi:hypothetical protein ACHAXT_001841 [Thalassiosira profunda]
MADLTLQTRVRRPASHRLQLPVPLLRLRRQGNRGAPRLRGHEHEMRPAVAVFKSNNTAVKALDGDKIGFMKVGDEGKYARPYCTDCGTMLANV